MTYLMIDIINIAVIMVGCFLGGFLPMIILIGKCPEALTFIKCMLSGGIIISKSNAAGQREFILAHPLGTEGQYIAGKNNFGQREIYIRPQTNNGQFNKSFILSGIRRPIFDAFSGKTIMVPPSVLAAIEVAERDADGKKQLPPDVQRWAEDNKVNLTEVEEIIETTTNKTEQTETKSVKKTVKTVFHKFLELDPTKLNHYFPDWLNQSQLDVLLQKADQTGYLRGLGIKSAGAGSGNKKYLIIGIFVFVIIIIVGVVGLMMFR